MSFRFGIRTGIGLAFWFFESVSHHVLIHNKELIKHNESGVWIHRKIQGIKSWSTPGYSIIVMNNKMLKWWYGAIAIQNDYECRICTGVVQIGGGIGMWVMDADGLHSKFPKHHCLIRYIEMWASEQQSDECVQANGGVESMRLR